MSKKKSFRKLSIKLFMVVSIVFSFSLSSVSSLVSAQSYKEVTSRAYYDYNRLTGVTSGLYGAVWIWVPVSAYVTEIYDTTYSTTVTKIVYQRNYYFSHYN